jgi:hypothetical protein
MKRIRATRSLAEFRRGNLRASRPQPGETLLLAVWTVHGKQGDFLRDFSGLQ